MTNNMLAGDLGPGMVQVAPMVVAQIEDTDMFNTDEPTPGEYRFYVEQLTPVIVTEAQRIGLLHSAAIRREVRRRLQEAMETYASPRQADAGGNVERMATRVLTMRTFLPRYTPIIDAHLAAPDKSWRWHAEPLMEDFSVVGSFAPSQYPTRVKVMYDATNIYIGVECWGQGRDMLKRDAGPGVRDGPVLQDDSIEIFIRSREHPERYAHLAVSAGSALLDGWEDGSGMTRAQQVACNLDVEVAAAAHEQLWIAELRVPWSELQTSPQSARVMRMNVVRHVVGCEPPEVSSWYPVLSGEASELYNQGWMILQDASPVGW